MNESPIIHTLKNNLQVLHSLCALHTRRITDPDAQSILARTKTALMIYADAYDLAKPHLEYFLLGPLLQRVITRVVASHPGVRLASEGPVLRCDAQVPWGLGISAALLVNEVVAEVVLVRQKQWEDGPLGELVFTADVTSTEEGNELQVRVRWREDSPWELAASRYSSSQGRGSENPVIEALAAQCEATLWWEGEEGVKIVVGMA